MAERAPNHPHRGSPRLWLLALTLVAALLVWAGFGSIISQAVATSLFLRNGSPSEDAFDSLLVRASDPAVFLTRCWQSDRIPQRQLVAACLKNNVDSKPAWLDRVEPLLLAGSVDPDVSVRELSLATLKMRRDANLVPAAEAQLKDRDPMVRELGLQYLRDSDPRQAVPLVSPLLDDPDLQVACRAEAALARWSGQDFGVRVSMAMNAESSSDSAERASLEHKIHQGLAQRKRWLVEHAADFNTNRPAADTLPVTIPERAEDFTLPSPTGAKVKLSSLRGRVVILNFWATWCTACLAEIPQLNGLQRDLGREVHVVGIALDGLPDEHHHPLNAAGEAEERSVGKSLRQIQSKVLKAIATYGIDYTVLLDPSGAVGGRFNGGELPTTVVLDPAGRVRRRFIGPRALSVLKAMVAEAARDPLDTMRAE